MAGLLDSFPSGQDRRAWLDRQGEQLARGLLYYLGPGLYPQVENLARAGGALSDAADVRDTFDASGRVMGGLLGGDYGQAGLAGVDMLGAGAAAMLPGISYNMARKPIAAAGGLLEDTGRRLMADETGAIKGFHGSPHDYAAERLVKYPDGRTEFITGKPDALPDVPPGAEVVRDYPLGRMRTDKIGTGEGAQAYGHGLYIAGKEGVAKSYKNALADTVIVPDGTPNLEKRAAQMALTFGDNTPEGAIAWLGKFKDGANHTSPAMTPELVEAVSKKFSSGDFKPGGKMYEVNINADPEDFLDWDKPLSEQMEKIRRGYEYAMGPQSDLENPVSKMFNGGKVGPANAKMMRQQGIPGIKYLDQGSRGAGEGSRNYVVFDDSLIEILRKYGLLGTAGGATAGGLFAPED